ncbi:cell wall metabolism sensor histidine kinase WalK [Butyrivibrio sp. INlla16]|uniref:sensor histidine kinase n=1 Tax=Butyrivibrio sp. INlla16 TaxID=1520807 RepID=UPI0008823BCF|nr:HAMP domain-containing sensor histidine kinase [Butyrivibrio sp. INlla16]SDB65376.1 His Kinase A (phospho-acceptor) domain-containing protein [Butyrivibrio sp. INlla16]
MVKKLRRKFVLTAMISLLVILIGIIGVINIVNFTQVQTSADETLDILSENDGNFPDMKELFPLPPGINNQDDQNIASKSDDVNTMGPAPFFGDRMAYNRSLEIPFQSRYFWVKLNKMGTTQETDTSHIAAVSEEEAQEYANKLFQTKSFGRGYIGGQYRYLVHQNNDGSYLMIFMDCSAGFYNANKLLFMTLLIGLVALIAMFVLVFLLSGKAVAPVVESLEKQKRFITDAGHELKTPLAVISANMDVIELEAGESEWTKSTKNQIKRMDGLVKNLLTLSRMEEENIDAVFSEVNMSSVLEESATFFIAVADFKKVKYTREIAENIHINGDRNSIQQLCTILIDNAMKYTPDEGEVSVSLSGDESSRNAILEISNSCENIPKGNLDRLFDRFYRADNSRSRKTGGYGIGLSVAKAIVNSHGGTIEAKAVGENIMKFMITIPIMKKS